MVHYADEITLGAALELHLASSGFSKETYAARVPVRVGRLEWLMPNPEFRQRTLILHDL